MRVHTWQHFEVQRGSYVISGWHISMLGLIDVVDQLEHECELQPRPAWHSGQIPLRSSLTIILACCRFRPQNSCRKALGNSRLFFANNSRYGLQSQMRLRLHGLEKVWVEKDKPIHRTAGICERKERLPRLKGKQLLFPTNFSCPNEHCINE